MAVTGFDLQAALESRDIVEVKEHVRSLHHLVRRRSEGAREGWMGPRALEWRAPCFLSCFWLLPFVIDGWLSLLERRMARGLVVDPFFQDLGCTERGRAGERENGERE